MLFIGGCVWVFVFCFLLSYYMVFLISVWCLIGDFVCLIFDFYNFDLFKGYNKGRCLFFKIYKVFVVIEKVWLVLYIFILYKM